MEGIHKHHDMCQRSHLMKKDPLSDEQEDLKTCLMLATGIGIDLALLQSIRQSKTLMVLVVIKTLLVMLVVGLLWYFA